MSAYEHPTYAELRRRFRAGDNPTRHLMIEDGAAFASFSIMTPTETAERLFRRWIEAGRPVILTGITKQLSVTRERRLLSVTLLSDMQVEFLSCMRSPNLDRIFAQWTWGYGPAKASFAMACAGIGQLPCLDRRLMKKHDIPEHDLERWPGYLDWCERLYPGIDDKASAGAREWLIDPSAERYETDHDVLLGGPSPQLLLGIGGT
ncbi:MAG: hypothetical protein ACRETG_02730 [Steroidobacteraceae bacterium]